MKRISTIISALLLAALTLSAQTTGLDGTWIFRETENKSTEQEDGKGKMDSAVTMTYHLAGDSYTLSVEATMSLEFNVTGKDGKPLSPVLHFSVSGSNAGSLGRNGDRLTLTPARGRKPQVDAQADVQGVPGGNMMKSMVIGPMKKELTNELKSVRDYKIISLTPTELTLEEILTEKELRQGEKPERQVLVRR